MRVVVKGASAGQEASHTFELVDFMDPATGDTAMARTTCFPATIAARMIARGEIPERGVRFPEELFAERLGDHLLEELENRGVRVRHTVD
jgi:saccharopine dehydrogenase-like NADP-dependent oxidoreductase